MRLLRFLLNLLVRAALLLVIAAQALYLARRPLAERWLCQQIGQVTGDALGGRATIGAIGGDWLTHLTVQGIQIESDGVLRRIEGAAIAVELDPWRLVHGDLGGVVRARIRATSAAIDLDTGASESAGSAGEPPDLAPFVALLPAGAEITIDACTVRGQGTEVAGRVHARLAHAHPGRARRLLVEAPAVLLEAELHPSGILDATARTPDAARVTRLFVAPVEVTAARCEAHATLTLAPRFECLARAQIGACEAYGQAVTRATASVRIDTESLRDANVELWLAGAHARARVPALIFADPLPRHAEVHAQTDDLALWTKFLPPDLRAELPLVGPANTRCSLAGRQVSADLGVVAGGLLPDTNTRLVLRARAGDAGLEIVDLQVDSPQVTVGTRGTLHGISLRECIADPNAVLGAALHADVDLQAHDLGRVGLDRVGVVASGRIKIAGTVTGTLARPDPQLALLANHVEVGPPNAPPWCSDASLRASVSRTALRIDAATGEVLGQRVRAKGDAQLRDATLTFTDVMVTDARSGSVQLSGSLGWREDFDWRAMLQTGADLGVEVTELDPLPWLPQEEGAQQPAMSTNVSGTLHWRTRGEVDVGATLNARADRLAGFAEPVTASVTLRGDARTTGVTELRVALGPAVVQGTGHADLSPIDLLAGGEAFANAAAHADLDVAALPLADLLAWAGIDVALDELRGTLSAKAKVRGTLAAPDITGTLSVAGGALRTMTGERLEDIAATIEVAPNAVRIVQATASRGTGPLTLTGELSAARPLWQAWPAANLSLALQGTNVLVHRRAGLRVRADLDVVAKGPLDDIAITGSVAVRDSKLVTRVPLFDLRRTGGASTSSGLRLPDLSLPAPLRARLDIAITTAEPFAAKTNVLEGNLNAQLELLGDLSAPRLQGTVNGPDAVIILPGCRLRASALLLQFTAENPETPTVTLTARGRRHGYDIRVNARGPFDRPDIEFSSDPPLPPDELVVLVTTGARPSTLRGTRGVGTVLGAYVAQEFADWAFGSESTEAKETFINRFTIETGTEMSRSGNESIVVEFRVGDRTYLQGERDVYDDINMGVIYRLRFK